MLSRFTTNNEQQCIQTSKANNSTSSGEPSRETRSARSCRNRVHNTSLNHSLRSGADTTAESDTSNTIVMRELLHFQACRRHSSHQRLTQHTTTMLDDLTTATTDHDHNCTPRKQKASPTRRQTPRRATAEQGMNTEILPPQGKIK